MDEEKLSDFVKSSIIDRLEGWELVEFLGIDISEIVDTFEEEISVNLQEVLDLIGMEASDDNE